jgi:hypothetical protein
MLDRLLTFLCLIDVIEKVWRHSSATALAVFGSSIIKPRKAEPFRSPAASPPDPKYRSG